MGQLSALDSVPAPAVGRSKSMQSGEDVNMSFQRAKIVVVLIAIFCFLETGAQMLPNPYGAPVSVDNAKKAASAALAEAVKNHWKMAVAVVDPHGTLVYYEK